MAIRRIQEFLDGNNVRYAVVSHSPAYTASEVAESTHISGRFVAKVVLVNIDGELAMAVVPASRDVDLGLLRRAIGKKDVRLAYEAEFADRFEGCQLGTVPPFGNLFGIQTFVDRSLAKLEHIAFNAGTHRDVMVIKTDDYLRLAQPELVHIEFEPIRDRLQSLSL